MTKRGMANTAAGILTAAAVALGSTGGAPSTDRDFTRAGGLNDSVAIIEEAVGRLVDKSEERGMTLPNSPGINDVTSGMDEMSPTQGTTREVKVSRGGSISKGDYIKVCQEFVGGSQTRIGTGVNIIAAASDTDSMSLYNNRSEYGTATTGILYTQGGDTKLTTVMVAEDGTVTTGGTVTVLEGTELTYADMAMDWSGQCIIAYVADGNGMMSRVAYDRHGSATLSWSQTWLEGCSPTNVCLAYEPVMDLATVCCTRLPDDSEEEGERYAEMLDTIVGPSGMAANFTNRIPLTAEAWLCLSGIDYSTASYPGGWDVTYAANWYYDQAVTGNEPGSSVMRDYVLFVTYPIDNVGQMGSGRGLIVVDHSFAGDSIPRNYYETMVPFSLPNSTAIEAGIAHDVAHDGEFGSIALTSLLHNVGSQRYGYGAALEVYALMREGSKPVQVLYRATDEKYSTSLSKMSVWTISSGFSLGYASGSNMYGVVVDVRGDHLGMQFGPAINIASYRNFATIVPVNTGKVAVVYQNNSNYGYIKMLEPQRVVARTTADQADGVALESGISGRTIRADITYWPEREE